MMFSQEADKSRYQRSDSVAADLSLVPRVSDRIPAATANCRRRKTRDR